MCMIGSVVPELWQTKLGVSSTIGMFVVMVSLATPLTYGVILVNHQ